MLTYFHVARRSVAALYSWAGVALVWVLVAVLHGGMETIAVCMLAASGFVLVAMSVPTLAAVVRPVSRTAVLSDGAVQLPSAEIDLSLVIPFYNPGHRLAEHVRGVVPALSGPSGSPSRSSRYRTARPTEARQRSPGSIRCGLLTWR